MILAGDIGGTKTSLGLYTVLDGGQLMPVERATVRSADYPGLQPLLERFLRNCRGDVEVAAFGVAAPVVGNRAQTPNLAWTEIDGDAIASAIGVRRLALLNDLVATAIGVGELGPADTLVLQEGEADPEAAVAVIAAGTGLGMTVLLPSPLGPLPMPSEGGHISFAPRDERELRLLRYLQELHEGRVSVERVVSGPGILSIYRFLRDREGMPGSREVEAEIEAIPPDLRPERAAAVLSAAAPRCPLADATLDFFVSAYGAVAGDLALLSLARGGLWIGGGIAQRNLERMKDGTFMRALCDKGRYSGILERIPVRVALAPDTALLGAARRGERLLNEAAKQV